MNHSLLLFIFGMIGCAWWDSAIQVSAWTTHLWFDSPPPLRGNKGKVYNLTSGLIAITAIVTVLVHETFWGNDKWYIVLLLFVGGWFSYDIGSDFVKRFPRIANIIQSLGCVFNFFLVIVMVSMVMLSLHKK